MHRESGTPKRVVVAMSGGVDSSAAAALLVEQGYDVIGIMLRLWSEPGKADSNRCCTPEAMASARRVAGQLGIPFYAVDLQAEFRQAIVESFLDGYAQGVTPNPCLNCNRQIRFGHLLERARALGAEFLATGHYARTRLASDGSIALLRAVDPQKDQSYVLSILTQQQLQQARFPVGEFSKTEVRQLARRFGLAAAERSDSQDLCFLAGDDYRNFLRRHAPQINQPGQITNRAGNVLGEHQGLANYTIGQRKGLGVFASAPLYVLDKDRTHNALIVGEAHELGAQELVAVQVNWIRGAPPVEPFNAMVKIRYQAHPAEALVTPISGDQAHVGFAVPLRDITPGQAAVFYTGELCLGGGIIQRSG
jgi:tRNA-uridine 2-sulfurtransferase